MTTRTPKPRNRAAFIAKTAASYRKRARHAISIKPRHGAEAWFYVCRGFIDVCTPHLIVRFSLARLKAIVAALERP